MSIIIRNIIFIFGVIIYILILLALYIYNSNFIVFHVEQSAESFWCIGSGQEFLKVCRVGLVHRINGSQIKCLSWQTLLECELRTVYYSYLRSWRHVPTYIFFFYLLAIQPSRRHMTHEHVPPVSILSQVMTWCRSAWHQLVMSSIHLLDGLPLDLTPSTLLNVVNFSSLSSAILAIWPKCFNFLVLTVSINDSLHPTLLLTTSLVICSCQRILKSL